MTKNILIIILYLLVGCQSRKSPYFQELISTKEITLTKVRGPVQSDSITLSIPIEFSLNLNNSDIKSLVIYYVINGKQLMQVEDFLVYNGKSNKVMSVIEKGENNIYPESIYIRQIKHISKKEAELLIKKYNPLASINNIRTGADTIKLVSYKKYIEDNPSFIKEMRKEPDSLILSIGFFKKESKVIGEKIKWLNK
ncbi:hypothetical protein IUY40_09385 [Flavobacterium sp. ALJ2]|uniref:hypothetical protein n=1 Tax=Flavobacterium sp. ALJ2 TaxID=2786960 RepID=UPI0018A10133|nr:hypothetical protein [Flavobacterium sp. ALJ2]MBF7091754.1 hypothetical protein [Flavobacterium sp. ALJ2]